MTKQLAAYLAGAYAKYYVPVAALTVMAVFVIVHDPHAWFVGLLALSLAATLTLFMLAFEIMRRRECETLQSFGVPLAAFAAPLAFVSLTPQILIGASTVAIARAPAHAALYALAALLGVAIPMAVVLIRCWKRPTNAVAATIVLGFSGWVTAAAVALLVLEG
jgi:hypothetical protein